jgi:predicted unusual protein kinase regulating ubiquinone biosynthesis (AarF/ABC1/UbiB family)
MVLAFLILVVAAVAMFALLMARPRRIPGGRLRRIVRLGRLSGYLATTWLGAKVRRLFMTKAGRARYDEARRRADAEAVVKTMGEMKGVVMKLGQMLSFVSDGVPAEYRAALQSLQAAAPPMDFAAIRDVAERELGMSLERAFARFDVEPLAAASIGQVHRARLRSGDEVAVKVQYPGVADAIRSDLGNAAVLYRMVSLFYPSLEPGPIIEELRARIGEELDYAHEARNQRAFAALYQDHPFIRVPRVYGSHSTARVLTSELVDGRRFAEVVAGDPLSRDRFGEILYRFVFGSIHRHGVFNADPQPGNYLYDAQGRVVFLDYGCVKYFPEAMLGNWMELVRAHMERDVPRFRALAVAAGFITAEAPVAGDVLFDYFGHFYEPFATDQVFAYGPEHNRRALTALFRPEGRFQGIQKHLNIPRDFALVNRLSVGVTSILTQLEAVGNWHRIHRELVFGDRPSTVLGELDHRWRLQRGLTRAEVLLRPEGPVDRGLIRARAAVAG